MRIGIRRSRTSHILAAGALLGMCAFLGRLLAQDRIQAGSGSRTEAAPFDNIIHAHAGNMLERGREIFRYDTFGSQDFWGGTLQLHQAIEGSKLGGVGLGVSPKTALAVGLKVDMDALPAQLIAALEKGQVNLDDPATTLALLRLNSVVGVTGYFDDQGTLRSLGIQCAFCHSTVDNSLVPDAVWMAGPTVT